MNRTTEMAFRMHITSRKGTEFQSLIEKLYLICYGNKFTVIKQKRDRGADGILNGRTVIAVYAPEKPSLKAFKRKIKNDAPGREGDFDKYVKHWQQTHGWQLVYNGEFTAEMEQFARSFEPNVELLGISHLLELIQRQPWGRIRELAVYLGIEESYIVYNIFDKIVQDLLMGHPTVEGTIEYSSPVYIQEKIPLNFSGEYVEKIKDEYRDSLKYFHQLKTIMKEYSDDDLRTLKCKVNLDIEKYQGAFKDRFVHLTLQYAEAARHDDLYKHFVRTLLIYLFEQCLLGKKTEEEKEK